MFALHRYQCSVCCQDEVSEWIFCVTQASLVREQTREGISLGIKIVVICRMTLWMEITYLYIVQKIKWYPIILKTFPNAEFSTHNACYCWSKNCLPNDFHESSPKFPPPMPTSDSASTTTIIFIAKIPHIWIVYKIQVNWTWKYILCTDELMLFLCEQFSTNYTQIWVILNTVL